jgi:tight adherence protein B
MFGIDSTVLMFVVLAGMSAGAVAYAFLFNRISEEKNVGKRLQTIKAADSDRASVKASRDRVAEAAKRRKSVQESLKELDEKQKLQDRNVSKAPLKLQIRQAGLDLSLGRFYLYSAICGLALTLVAFMAGLPPVILPGVLVAGGLGLPRWIVSFLRARRVKAFLNEFPNALDIIVRAVKSGLPLNDGVRLIASEAPEPVRRCPADGPVHSRCRHADARNHAVFGSGILRNRHPDSGAGRWQSVGGSWQSFACVA